MIAPKHLLYWPQQIFIYQVNVRILIEISIEDYQFANAMNSHASSNHKRNVSSQPKSHCIWIHTPFFLQHPSHPSSVCKIHLHSSESTTKDHLSLVLQCWILSPRLIWFCLFWYKPRGFLLATRLNMSPAPIMCMQPSPYSFFYDECMSKNVIQSKDNSEVIFKLPNLDSIFRRLFFLRADVCFGRLPDSLYLAPLFWNVFYSSWIALQLHDFKSHYVWAL